ncbi:hypothetical protein DU18_0303 [Chlamydia muridarum]|nr:hypothetical protein DU17_0302 [Chlamydia muridarum]KDU81269.1 hypothetical protein DU18_0303 [Chlamydia muridarum]KDU84221.1 hypothetical protein DU21_0302 [Chlamydia muridarum]
MVCSLETLRTMGWIILMTDKVEARAHLHLKFIVNDNCGGLERS